MSHDNAHGKITYHTETDDVSVSYKDVGYEPNFTMVNEAASKVAEKLGGMFMTNLLWSECLGKSVVTVHPLGGCPMAESGQTGVVNHAGQVFEGALRIFGVSCHFDFSKMPLMTRISLELTAAYKPFSV